MRGEPLPPERYYVPGQNGWVAGTAVTPVLHPSTEPAAIAAAQRREIAKALRTYPRASLEELSAMVILPISIVHKRLLEIENGQS